MHLSDRFKIYLPLAKQTNITEQNISVFNLMLTSFLIYRNPITPLDKIALSKHSAHNIQSTWCDKTLIGKDDFDLFRHGVDPRFLDVNSIPYIILLRTCLVCRNTQFREPQMPVSRALSRILAI